MSNSFLTLSVEPESNEPGKVTYSSRDTANAPKSTEPAECTSTAAVLRLTAVVPEAIPAGKE